MRKIFKFLIIAGVAMSISNCSKSKLGAYEGEKPELDIKEYFNGPIKAWGMVQDWRGKVTRRFDVEMKGEWEGNKGTLTEHFKYYDGKTQDRVWHITKLSDDRYEGRASDVSDVASGMTSGNTINWHYHMDLEVDGKKYNIKFDDWMWLMNDGVLINRSYLKKFGIKVAELTIFMQKQDK